MPPLNTLDDAMLRQLFQVAIVGIMTVDKSGTFTHANDSFLQMVGYSADEVDAGKVTRELLTPERWKEADQAAIAQVERSGAMGWREKEYRHKDGHVIPVVAGGAAIAGDLTIGFVLDISERKRHEAELLLQAQVIQNASDAVMRSDSSGCILSWNRGAERIFGFTEAEVLGKRAATFLNAKPLDGSSFAEISAQRHLGEYRGEIECTAKNGSAVFIDMLFLDVRYGNEPSRGAFATAKDITARKKAERAMAESYDELERRVVDRTAALTAANEALQREIEERKRTQAALQRSEDQLRHAQKMEAVGRLAGGVAHDFNNLLSVILSYTSLNRDSFPNHVELHADLDEIHKAGTRAAELTQQLLAFSRQQVMQPKVTDLGVVISEMDKMLRRVLGEDIELKTLVGNNLWQVKVDPGQIDQVVMNLAVNARDAMIRGGRLTIETSNVLLDESYARDHLGVKPGEYVMLAVSDTGVGMDRVTQTRIFEPFFTTKQQGKGTGLGLSTVFGIVQQSAGAVWVYSELGTGTTFKIYLPRSSEHPRPASEPAPRAPARVRDATILLVEDEPQVLQLTRMILAKAGYHVIDAGNPADALAVAANSATTIHLLLTDVVMPGMNGRELAERLVTARPTMKVVFMSGYTGNVVVHHGVLDEGVAFLQKPITPDALLLKIAQALG